MSGQDDADLNVSADENRILATGIATTLRELQGNLLELAIGIGKWLLTSLLAINGAAAVATWQSQLDPSTKLIACSAFVAGILAALLCGALQLRQISRMSKPLGEAIGYWLSVQADGVRSGGLEDFEAVEKEGRKVRSIWAVGLLSVALFLVGGALAAAGNYDCPTTSPRSIPPEDRGASPSQKAPLPSSQKSHP